jgi:hypothetical protein
MTSYRLRTRTYVLRSSAYNATTLRKDYAELFSGTSSAIGRACDSLKELRAQVVVGVFTFGGRDSLLTIFHQTSSEEGRLKLVEMNSVPHVSPPSILALNLNPVHHPSALPSAEISRPRSCPPILSGRKSDVPQLAFAESSESIFGGCVRLNRLDRPSGQIPSAIPHKGTRVYKQPTLMVSRQPFIRQSPSELSQAPKCCRSQDY